MGAGGTEVRGGQGVPLRGSWLGAACPPQG